MKKCLMSVLVFLTSLLILSAGVFAASPTTPYFNFSAGTFNYDAGNNALSISVTTIGMVVHADGSFAFNQYMDPIWGGNFTLSTLYNGDGAGENWSFSPSPGSPDFVLYDYYGNQRLTAEINNFTVVQNGSLFQVNVGFDQYNVGSISTETNSPSSAFISDVNSFSQPGGNLYMAFNFTGGGATDFTGNNSGTVSGAFSVVPEPVSSILFITGGAAFAFRRHIRKRKHLNC